MKDSKDISARDKAILIGLFLARFGRAALDAFGFTSFRQAYNALGYSIGFLPKSMHLHDSPNGCNFPPHKCSNSGGRRLPPSRSRAPLAKVAPPRRSVP